MKIKTEFTADNLTIFGGYFNIFNFFVKSNIFKKLDKFISVKKKKKIYEKLDYIVSERKVINFYKKITKL